ncbi:MAG: hypothetical protein ACT4QG_13980 [Sporichthyaceae bacterium]
MSAARRTSHTIHRSPEPRLQLAVRRFDVIELAGAAVVVLLMVAVALLLVHEAASDRPEENFPPLPFSGGTLEQPLP